MSSVSLSSDFLDNYMFRTNHAYAMVYLCAYRYKSQGQPIPPDIEIAKILGMKTSDVQDAVKYWKAEGFNIFDNAKKPVPADKSSYKPSEISSFMQEDPDLAFLYEEAQKSMGKTLSTTDIQTLFWLYDHLGLSTSVIMLIVNYAKKTGNARMRYIEKTAVDWADKGITTVPAAEEYLAKLDALKTYEYKIARLFQLDRPLLPSEKAVVEEWAQRLKPPEELLFHAYEICIERKNKFSMKYINGIVKSWLEKGYRTTLDIQQEKRPAPAEKTTAFKNYTQRTDIDYSRLEAEALQKRISRAKQVNE